MDKRLISFRINDERRELEVDPSLTLLEVLREELRLTGTKRGCGRGDCGACTVIMDGRAVLSCLIPILQADGTEITTVEGLAKNGELHPLQQAFIDAAAIQCGFCTPGMLLSAKAFIDQNPMPTREEARMAISGNLCRCTGYKKIVDAIMLAAARMRSTSGVKS